MKICTKAKWLCDISASVCKNKSSQGWTLGVKFGEFGGESFGKKKKEKVSKALEKRVLDISSFIYL